MAGRVWNLASATTNASGLELVNSASSDACKGAQAVLVLSAAPLPDGATTSNVAMDDVDTLPLRLRTAIESSREPAPVVRIELPVGPNIEGTFTVSDAQTYAVLLLDAICAAFEGM